MSVRSPSGASPSSISTVPLDTGRLSPVRADSSTSSVAHSSNRPSAGTTSPASTRTTSPGTSSSAGSRHSSPPRRTRAFRISIFCSAATAAAALPSCCSPRSALKSVSDTTTRPVASSPSAKLPIAAASRTSCIESRYWRRNARQRGSGRASTNRFGPISASRRSASAPARPTWTSTSSSRVASSAGSACHLVVSSAAIRIAGRVCSVAMVPRPFRCRPHQHAHTLRSRDWRGNGVRTPTRVVRTRKTPARVALGLRCATPWACRLPVRYGGLMPVRVVLGEDSLIVREGVQQLLASDSEIDVVAAVGDLDALRTACERDTPDVVVTDIRMPPTLTDEGIRIAAELRVTHPEVGVVVLSQYADPVYALALLEHGSDRRAYLLKERVHNRAELTAAIRAGADNGSMVDARVVDGLGRARTVAGSSPIKEPPARGPWRNAHR